MTAQFSAFRGGFSFGGFCAILGARRQQKGAQKMADWSRIKTEYITTDTSYRKLAEKYGVSQTQICNRGKRERWVEKRNQHLNKTVAKSLDKISEKQAARIARLSRVADRLLDKVEQAAEELDLAVISTKETVETATSVKVQTYQEVDEEKTGLVDRRGLKQLTSAMKDIREVQMLISELDRQEKEAKIAKLQKEIQQDDTGTSITVTLEGEMREYAQ